MENLDRYLLCFCDKNEIFLKYDINRKEIINLNEIKYYNFFSIDINLIKKEINKKINFINIIMNYDNFKKNFKIKIKRKNNYYNFIIRIIYQKQISNYIYIFIKDYSKYYNEIKLLKKQLLLDPQTKLYNKKIFINRIKREIKDKKEFNIIFMDIDNFKKINDDFGHLIGDKIISYIGYIIRSISKIDFYSARYGGDEFVIKINNKDDILIFLERLNKILKKGFIIENSDIKIALDISFGISNYPNDSTNLYDLINISDKNMYKLKNIKKSKKYIIK